MIEFLVQLSIQQICLQCGSLGRQIEIKRIMNDGGSVSSRDLNSDESFEEERQPLFDDRPTFILTNDEIMRQFVQEID